MRVNVIGDNGCASTLRGYLRHQDIAVSAVFPDYTVRVESHDLPEVVIDSVESAIEQNVFNAVAKELEQHRTGKRVSFQREDGVRSDSEIRVLVPNDEGVEKHVALGIYIGIERTINPHHKRRRRLFGKFFILVLVLGMAGRASAQVHPSSTSGGGAGGTVTQGTPAATANAWPMTLCNDTKTTCVTFTGTSENVNVTNGSIAVTGTFWQGTQPVSGPLTDTQLRATAVPVSGTFFQSTQPVSATSLPLPSNAAIETGGNLATIAGKDFATSAKQDTMTTSLTTLDTDIKAAQPRKIQDANGNGITVKASGSPATLADTALVVTFPQQQQAPVLTQQQASNQLLYNSAMKQFCKTNLCPGVK